MLNTPVKSIVFKSVFLLIVYTLLFLAFKYVFVFAVVCGKSMENTLHDGDVLFCTRISNTFNKGDIALIDLPSENEQIIKRVIAVGGDRIEIKDNVVYINNKEIKEPYIKETMLTADVNPVTVPEGYMYVMGDNRNNSLDSRRKEVGLVNIKDRAFGKVVSKMGMLQYIVALVLLSGLVLFTDSVISSDFVGKESADLESDESNAESSEEKQ